MNIDGDHARAAVETMRCGIDIYCSQGTADALELSGHRVNIIKARKQLTVGPWTILPFEAVHNAAEPLGFLIYIDNQKLVYITDSAYVPVKFRRLNIIAVECNYALDILQANESLNVEAKKRTINNHFSLAQVKRLLKANDLKPVREIHLLHLSDGNSDSERFKREVQQLSGKPTYVAGK